jgi:hypothetical protein
MKNNVTVLGVFNIQKGRLYSLNFGFDFIPMPGMIFKIDGIDVRVASVNNSINEFLSKSKREFIWDLILESEEKINFKVNQTYTFIMEKAESLFR